MTRIFLIRHGEPEAAWGQADDPGLSEAGRRQAELAAEALPAGLRAVTSPMARCRQTAAPYEARFGGAALVDARVSEVATPAGLSDRRAWLAETFPWRAGSNAREWRTLSPALHEWRDDVWAAVHAADADTAFFTHFIAINAVVGAALGQTQTIVFKPAHASITELALEGGALRVVTLGARMDGGDVA